MEKTYEFEKLLVMGMPITSITQAYRDAVRQCVAPNKVEETLRDMDLMRSWLQGVTNKGEHLSEDDIRRILGIASNENNIRKTAINFLTKKH